MLGLFFLLRENNEVLIDIVVDATDKITECQETLYSPNLLNCNFVRSINDNIDENFNDGVAEKNVAIPPILSAIDL